jgi:hypothetical protein
MPVMDVRKVRMSVDECIVPMHVGVWFGPVPWKIVPMPMMLVMPMRVFMGHRFVRVDVLVAFGEV